MTDSKETKPKTCWVLYEEYNDYYTYTYYKRIFKSKPTKKKLKEAFLDKNLEMTTGRFNVDEVIKELLEGGSFDCINLVEQTIY